MESAGTWGDVSVLSFGGSKLLTAGRGGAILTGRTDVAERIKRYVQRGNEAYPLSEVQAAIVCAQIEELDRLNEFRRNAVRTLCRKLADVVDMDLLQGPSDDVQPVYYKVGFRYSAGNFGGLLRSQFVHAMRRRNCVRCRVSGTSFDSWLKAISSCRRITCDESSRCRNVDAPSSCLVGK